MGLSLNHDGTATFIYAYGLWNIRLVKVSTIDECVKNFIKKALEVKDFESEVGWECRQREFIKALEWLEVNYDRP